MKSVPVWVPKNLAQKANATICKTISSLLEIDSGSHKKQSIAHIERLLTGLLEWTEQQVKEDLTSQLAEQLYNWFDRHTVEKAHPALTIYSKVI